MSNEPIQTVIPVIIDDVQPEVTALVQSTGLAQEALAPLQQSFAPYFTEAKGIIEKSRAIIVTDASQKLELKLARTYRLALRTIRNDSDKMRKALKEDSLRRSKAIDGFHNILLHVTESEEKRLQEQEDFVERKEAARKASLKIERENALAPYGLDTSFMALADMPDEVWAQLLDNTRTAFNAKQEELRKAEEDRIRAEHEKLKENARIREENDRLKHEAEAREVAARKEREAIEANAKAEREELERKTDIARRESELKLRAEQEARAKAESEAIAAKKAEADRLAKEQESRERAEAAPDGAKLLAFAELLRTLPIPTMTSRRGKFAALELKGYISEAASYARRTGDDISK